MKTYNEIYLDARRQLVNSGIENASFEAKQLLCAASHKSLTDLIRDFQLYTSDEISEITDELTIRRIGGEPLAYVTNSWEFYGLSLYINSNVLIPRIDTEVIVDVAREILSGKNMNARILDLCCGSGCITCALAKTMPASKFVSVDISSDALAVTRKNISAHGFTSRAVCMQSDVLSHPPMGIGLFDMIISNPPYIPSAEIEMLDPSVKDFEPRLALDGGDNGLKFYKAIIKYWKSQLKENGFILFEVGEDQSEKVQDMLLYAGFSDTDVRKDTIGVERVVIGKL